jgi:hypothetical protein
VFTTHQMPPARPVVDYVPCYSSGPLEHQMPRACPVDGYDRYWGRRWLRARSVRHHRTSRWHLGDIGTVYSSERNYPLDKPEASPGSWTVIERGSYFVSVATGRRDPAAGDGKSGVGSCSADAASNWGGSAVASPQSNATDRNIDNESKTGSDLMIDTGAGETLAGDITHSRVATNLPQLRLTRLQPPVLQPSRR